ncbi:MAG TPA: NAD(P)-dependent oxidoreductase [Vicinamibacterales bacterium]|nr:NAD(P)-dependent oxidoreductase [Vicinamibacterales bacterium]
MGGKWASSPRAVCEAADTTFVMVTNTAALEGASQGPDGLLAGLGAGKLLIDMSTVGPATSRELAAKVREKGADMLDAPVSGSISMVEQGKLSIMVGGPRATFDSAKPLLEDIGQKVTYIGENGLALSMKLATNISIAVQMLALAESVVLAEKAGVARETAIEVLTNSAIASPLVQYKGPCVLKMPEQPMFSANMMQKDVTLALELAREVQVTLPTGAVVNEFLSSARAQGLGEQDFAILYKVLAHMSGIA